MVGQAVGATGESPKDDRQDAGPTKDARRHQILFLFAITFENPNIYTNEEMNEGKCCFSPCLGSTRRQDPESGGGLATHGAHDKVRQDQ